MVISEGCQSVDVRDCFVANTPRKDFAGEFENTISVFARESRWTTAAISEGCQSVDVRDCFPFDFARLPKYLYGGQAQGRKDRYRVPETNVDVFAREGRAW